MDALIMAGGLGRRLEADAIKPLLKVRGKPLVNHVSEAACDAGSIDKVYLALTGATEALKDFVDIPYVMTDGSGFVDDLLQASRDLSLDRTFILSADLPLITGEDLDWVAKKYSIKGAPAMSVHVPLDVMAELGLSPTHISEGLVPSGVNIMDFRDLQGMETRLVTRNPNFAFNINVQDDLLALERHLSRNEFF